MKVAVPREIVPEERRVAAVPDTVAKLANAGFEVWVEQGAGAAAHFGDDAYRQQGAILANGVDRLYEGADVVLKVQAPVDGEVERIPEGAVLVGLLQPARNAELIDALAARKVTALALELLPRISRAQSMDALSSQASLGGYKAVVLGAARLDKIMPMQMTAAGTIPPARVFVLGAGVAGLQAIATARRLGAVVEAYDVRPAVKEEVQSLGARFVELPLGTAEGAGGYAREQSEEHLRRQRELLAEHVASADLVVTTAAVPGRKAPLLVTADMVAGMRPGSVIVDLAADSGGNCELTEAGVERDVGGVTIVGIRDLPRTVPVPASQTYARNLTNLLVYLVKDGELTLDFDDEIVKGCCVTHGGEVLYPEPKASLAATSAGGQP